MVPLISAANARSGRERMKSGIIIGYVVIVLE
jgi:hypothetical protein